MKQPGTYKIETPLNADDHRPSMTLSYLPVDGCAVIEAHCEAILELVKDVDKARLIIKKGALPKWVLDE